MQALLHSLRVKLDAGILQDTPTAFHARCLAALEAHEFRPPAPLRPLAAILHGAMYDLTNRCLHHFAVRHLELELPSAEAAVAPRVLAGTPSTGVKEDPPAYEVEVRNLTSVGAGSALLADDIP